MDENPPRKEKRKHPRTLITLPLHIELNENDGTCPGLTLDASESGLLIETFKEMPVGIRIGIEVFFRREFKLSNVKAEAEIIWKEIRNWDDWEDYQYGVKFTQISKEDYLKLKEILSDPTRLKKADFIERGDHNPKLVVRAG